MKKKEENLTDFQKAEMHRAICKALQAFYVILWTLNISIYHLFLCGDFLIYRGTFSRILLG